MSSLRDIMHGGDEEEPEAGETPRGDAPHARWGGSDERGRERGREREREREPERERTRSPPRQRR